MVTDDNGAVHQHVYMSLWSALGTHIKGNLNANFCPAQAYYFETAIEVVPPALQAMAAIAVTFALTFAGHHYVSGWSVVLALILGVLALFWS